MTDAKPPNRFSQLIAELTDRGLPVPAVLAGPEPLPLAITTRADLPAWAAAHGYDGDALAVLQRIVAMTVHSSPYHRALAADLSARHSLDGEATEYVDPADRLAAALQIHARALKETGLKPAAAIKPAPSPSPAKVASPSPIKRPSIRLGALSTEEIERRRVALRGVGR